MKITRPLTKVKETKNKVVYAEQGDAVDRIDGIYLDKKLVTQLGDPATLHLTLEAK